jgi:hypothetical protein
MTSSRTSHRVSGVAAQVALGWSLYVTLMGVYWTAGGAGYPLGHHDVRGPESGSLLTTMDSAIGGPVIAATGVVGLALLLLLSRGQPRTASRRTAMILAGGGFAVLLVAVAVDGRAITMLPPLGLVPIKWVEADWPTVFQMTVPVAAAAYFLATVAMARRTADRSPAGLARAAVRSRGWDRVGRIATYVAIVCPLPYAIIRLCWSRGWGVGAPEPFVESLLRVQPENVWVEPILAGFALTGVFLTTGLLSRWGRVFPSWIPALGGRRVPLWLPLGLGGSAVIGIGTFGKGMLLGRLGIEQPGGLSELQQWGMPVQGWEYWGVDGLAWILFPLWSVSLAVALAGYNHRSGPSLRYCAGSGRATSSKMDTATPLPEYDALRDRLAARFAENNVDSDRSGPPRRSSS